MGNLSSPLVAGLQYRNGTCLDSSVFVQFQAVKLTGANTYAPCAITDTDADVAGICLSDRNPGDPLTIPVLPLTANPGLPVLLDGDDAVIAGSLTVGNLTLSDAVAGRFKVAAQGAGLLRATTSSGAVADSVCIATSLVGAGGAGSALQTLSLNESGVGNQIVNHGRFWGALGTTTPLEGDNFYWDGWARPDGTGYLISDGYGGCHALLYAPLSQTGNVANNVLDAGDTVNFGGGYSVNPGEWVYFGVGCDGSYIYTFINGVCVGRVAWTGGRVTGGTSSDGFLLIGGPWDHQTMVGRVAWIRAFDVDKWPLTSTGGLVGPFQPQRWPSDYMVKSGSNILCDFLVDYSHAGRVFPDVSPDGARGQRWNGRPSYQLLGFDGAPGSGSAVAVPPLPEVSADSTCPLLADEWGESGEIAQTPSAVPVGALIFDSFGRANQTYAFQEEPTLGDTEGGSLGALTWQQGTAINSQSPQDPSAWGILGASAVMLGRNPYPVAWVEAGTADHWVHIKRDLGSWSTRTSGLAFRVQDNDNFLYLGIQSATLAQFGSVQGGAFTAPPGGNVNVTIPAGAEQISARCSGTDIEFYADGVLVDSVAGQNVFQTETMCGICAPNDSSLTDSLARYRDFLVKAS